ncbi:MAG: MMPL family transporter [Halioglobus sp.]
MTSAVPRWLFYLLLAVLLVCTARLLQQGPSIKYDLLSLLPQTGSSAVVAEASQRFTTQDGNQLLYVLSAREQTPLLRAAGEALQRIQQVSALEVEIPSRRAEEILNYTRALAAYRFTLLDDAQRRYLAETPERTLVRQRLRELYRPGAGALLTSPAEDPLGLFDRYVQGVAVMPENVRTQGDLLLLDTAEASYALISARVIPGAFDLTAQQQVLALDEALNAALDSGYPNVTLSKAGIVFHAGLAAAQAKKEVSIIALGSALGIIALFSLAFGSGRPLLLTLGSIFFGCTSAALITLSIFRELHLLTLVFGASLIGVAVDYALHALTRTDARGRSDLGALMPGLVLALLTSLIGFGSLLQAPVPGLQQMALFSMLGLVSAWLFVVVLFPRVTISARTPWPPLQAFARVPDELARRSRARTAMLAALAVLAGVGLWQVETVADLRIFHQADDALLEDQATIDALLPSHSANQFYLVRGASVEQVLQRAEALNEQLRPLHGAAVQTVLNPADHLPSLRQQRENRSLLNAGVYRQGGAADQLLQQLGFDSTASNEVRKQVATQPALTAEAWLRFAPPQLGQLLLGDFSGDHYAAIRLSGITDTEPLAAVAGDLSWLQFVDTVADISSDLQQRQNAALVQLGIAYLLIGIALAARYRRARALLLLGAPLLSSVATVAVLGLAGQPLTLFHVFGLFLVLGLGMDYSIFRHEAGRQREECMFAILLSMATSALSFGLLALSDTPMISAFGLTVLLGSIGNWLLLPLAVTAPTTSNQ